MTLFQVDIPANVKQFYTTVNEISEFEIFDYKLLTNLIFPFLAAEDEIPSLEGRHLE